MDRDSVIVTGSNRGIGQQIALRLACAGKSVIMACRNAERAEEAARRVRDASRNGDVEPMRLDLASFESIRTFAEDVARRGIGISALINNAGVLCNGFQRTIDGFETTLQVNYLGQFLLTRLLVPRIAKGSGRIINTSSVIYRLGRIREDLFTGDEAGYGKFRAYADSKLASLLFSLELADRLRSVGISVHSVDPGIVDTNILSMDDIVVDSLARVFFRPFIRNAESGAEASVSLALLEGGSAEPYYTKGKARRLKKSIIDHPQRQALWDRTEAIVGIGGPPSPAPV
jgi:NAD(P)-dependent dehydrogenase (short-subunit alcohol dehydrogenase family)